MQAEKTIACCEPVLGLETCYCIALLILDLTTQFTIPKTDKQSLTVQKSKETSTIKLMDVSVNVFYSSTQTL